MVNIGNVSHQFYICGIIISCYLDANPAVDTGKMDKVDKKKNDAKIQGNYFVSLPNDRSYRSKNTRALK